MNAAIELLFLGVLVWVLCNVNDRRRVRIALGLAWAVAWVCGMCDAGGDDDERSQAGRVDVRMRLRPRARAATDGG